MSEWDLEPSLIKGRLDKFNFINNLTVLDEVDSTNEFLKREAQNLQDRTLAVAIVQNSGKGSKGRSWTSSPESGVWMSLFLRPDIQMNKAPMLTLVMAVSVARACQILYNLPVQIKWPNDIVCNGKKICGILTEMKSLSDGGYGVVIGMGVNVNTDSFPQELREKATSIFLESGKKWQRFDLIGKIMECFMEDYKLFLQKSDLSLLLSAYSSMSVTVGKQVQVMDVRGSYSGKAVRIDKDGALVVECEDGSVKKIIGDEVSVRGIYGYV